MITFRKILASSAGKLVRAYLTQNSPEPSNLRNQPEKKPDASGRLTSYYTGRDSRAHWRKDMPASVARVLGIDPSALPSDLQLDRLFEARRGDTGDAWSKFSRVNSAFDFTFAPHKSISLAIEFADTPAEAGLLWSILDRVNHKAMTLIGKDLGWARRGKGGEDGVDPGETGWVSFRHDQARPTHQIRDGKTGVTYLVELSAPGDPHAHIHNAFFNLVVTKDGRVGSLDSQRMTDTRVLLYAAYAQAILAQELRDQGIAVSVDPSGRYAILTDIRADAVDLFSKGHMQTLRNAKAAAKRMGLNWSDLSAETKYELARSASTNERLKKNSSGIAVDEAPTDREFYRQQAASIAWEHSTVLRGVKPAELTDEQRFDLAYKIAASRLAEEFYTDAVLDRDKLALWATRGLIGVGFKGEDDIEKVVALIEERGITIRGQKAMLISGMIDGRVRITNTVQVEIERRMTELALAAGRDFSGALSEEALVKAIKASGLNFDNDHGRAQVAAIFALGRGSALTLLTGVAGAGKSTLLRPLVAAYQADTRYDPRGREVIGVSTAWGQADSLKGAGIKKTYAVATLLRAIETGEFRPTENTVVVLEEVSQIAPRAMTALLELQARTGCVIKGLGDREQCQAIEAGDSIEILNRTLPQSDRPALLSSVRQKTPEGLRIANYFRDGEAGKALTLKRRNGSAQMLGGDLEEVNEAIAEHFIRRKDALAAAGFKQGITCSTLTNQDAGEISRAIRTRLKARGEIASAETVYQAEDQNGERYQLPLSVGDRVRLYRKTWATIDGKGASIGSNGDVVTVEAITDQGLRIRTKAGVVGDVQWRRLKAEGSDRLLLGFGLAQTIDSIQGVTSDEHINAMPRGTAAMGKFRGYTAESRAEWWSWTMIGEAGQFEAIRSKKAIGDQTPITSEDLWEQAGKDLSRATYKSLGMDLQATLQEQEAIARTRFIGADIRVQRQEVDGRNAAAERQEAKQAEEIRVTLAPRLDGMAARIQATLGELAPERIAPTSPLPRMHVPRPSAPARHSSPSPGM